MFGYDYFQEVAEEMLEDFSFEEILEQNDVTIEEVLARLLETGVLEIPEKYE